MANEWADWKAAHPIVYSAASDESVASMSQKLIAEVDRIYSMLARLRRHDASSGTVVDDSIPYQFKVDTLANKLLIRNADNSAWINLGSISEYFGITPAQISAVATKGGIVSLQAGLDANKPLVISSAEGDMYLATDQKKLYRRNATDWELLLSLNVTNLNGYDTLVLKEQLAQTPGSGKIPVANTGGLLEYSITGNAAKIANKSIDTTDLADGRVLVYRDTVGGFVFETKGGTGVNGVSEIDDTQASTGTTYSSTKLLDLLKKKVDVTGDLTAYSVAHDAKGRIATVTVGSVTYTVTYDANGRLESISNGTTTLTAKYNAYGQYLGLGV